MKILAIDIGAGTQDILFFNNENELENSIKLVLPSPPVIVSQKIEKTENDLYFDGEIMGGGSIKKKIISHIKKGYKVAMEETAARTIKDDLKVVEDIGVEIVKNSFLDKKSNKSSKYYNYSKLTLKDVDIKELTLTIANYDLDFSFDYIAVAVQDHGFSEKMGDRNFRFEKIREKLFHPTRPEEFAFLGDIPEYFSRMKAVERTLTGFNPILMDSKFASVCGACYDDEVDKLNSYVVMDIGNGHTMAASIENGKIQGVFEHHTSSLNGEKLEKLVNRLVNGVITHEEVYNDHGHGAFVLNPISNLEKVVVTGPRRKIIEETNLDYYHASPGGDVMMTGPVGLIKSIEYHKNK